MSQSRLKLLAAFALVLIAISIFGRGVASRGFFAVLAGAEGERQPAKAADGLSLSAQLSDEPKSRQREQFTIYRNAEGEIVCRKATAQEIKERESIDPSTTGLRRINHLLLADAAQQDADSSGLMIILRATQQLQQNATATAAFTRAAQNWETLIMSPITIYIDVDYGSTNFGQTWPAGVLGATSAPTSSYPYQSVRTNLVAEANGEGNATKQAVFNALPTNTVTTDLGDAVSTAVSGATARAIGLLPATAQSTDTAPRIAFNSNFDNSFDFDPTDGIGTGKIDFDAVATHEIGHALGFHSEAGLSAPRPSIWDFYRFRTGTTSGTFTSAQRILTIGGSPDPLQFFFVPGNSELGLSTGGPAGSTSNGGDGWQSSHWKHATCGLEIGVMDPAIPNGCRRTITAGDQLALASFGYNLTNNAAPPPPPPSPTPPPNDNFVNAQAITGCAGSTTGSTFGATSEAGEPSHDPTDSTSLSPSHTVWYQWQAPSSGSTTITTAGSDFDTILAVYTGNSVGALTRLVFNDDVQSGVITTSTVTFNATAGTTYSIAVDGWGGDTGGIKLNWNGCAATPTPTPTPTPQPCTGSLSVNDNGDAPDTSPGNGVCATSGGVCTLRAAIQEANALSSCGPIDINFNGLISPIGLSTALPAINHSVSLNGPGASLLTVQRNAGADFRIFDVTVPTPGVVTLSGLTIANGVSGGGSGIINHGTGTVNVINSNLSNNSGNTGGAIDNNSTGTVNVINSNLTNNSAPNGFGGGIYNFSSGKVNISGTTLTNNSAGTGGAIYCNGGTLTMIGSSVSGNTATPGSSSSSGGIFNFGALTVMNSTVSGNTADFGAGISNQSGTLILINSTVSGNTARAGSAGGIFNFFGTAILTNVTVSANTATSAGGGMLNSGGTANLKNTLIANNTTNGAGPDLNGTFNSQDYNLIGNTSGSTFTGTTTHHVANINAQLGPLANNGGPTMTHALLAGSPAINAGSNALAVDQNNNPLTTDQRGTGFNRIVSGTVDIGAYELQTAPPANPIDLPDFFVKQHYLDFLNRTADQSGLDFWTGTITSCGGDPPCIEVKRINASAAFFLSIEFQGTGNLVYKMYKAAFGNLPGGKPVAVDRAPFMTDTRQIQSTPAQVIVGQPGWEAQLETNKQAFALAFVQRAVFQSAHANQDAATYVNSLFSNAGVTSPPPVEVANGINAFNSAGGGDGGRAAALRSVCESNSVSATLKNEAFVLMQYFGYLQRNPYDPPEATLDYSGYLFWLGKLNSFGGDYIKAEMVKAFIASDEYRHRFGP